MATYGGIKERELLLLGLRCVAKQSISPLHIAIYHLWAWMKPSLSLSLIHAALLLYLLSCCSGSSIYSFMSISPVPLPSPTSVGGREF